MRDVNARTTHAWSRSRRKLASRRSSCSSTWSSCSRSRRSRRSSPHDLDVARPACAGSCPRAAVVVLGGVRVARQRGAGRRRRRPRGDVRRHGRDVRPGAHGARGVRRPPRRLGRTGRPRARLPRRAPPPPRRSSGWRRPTIRGCGGRCGGSSPSRDRQHGAPARGVQLDGSRADASPGWPRLVVDYVGTILARRLGLALSLRSHFAERHGLIVIIALGESIVAIGVGVAHAADLVADHRGVGARACGRGRSGGRTSTSCRSSPSARSAAPRARRDAARPRRLQLPAPPDDRGHRPAGARPRRRCWRTSAAPSGHTLSESLAALSLSAMYGGVALFLLAHVAFAWRAERVIKVQRIAVAVLALALIPVAARLPGARRPGVDHRHHGRDDRGGVDSVLRGPRADPARGRRGPGARANDQVVVSARRLLGKPRPGESPPLRRAQVDSRRAPSLNVPRAGSDRARLGERGPA